MIRRLFSLTVVSVSLVLICVSVLGFAASAFWFFDLFNHFRVQYLVASGLGLLLAIALRSKALAWSFVGVAVFNALFLVPLYSARSGKPESLHELSIVSYNTWMRNDDWSSIQPVLREGAPDVVYFTEVHSSIQMQINGLESEFHILQIESNVLLVRRGAGLSPKLIEGTVGDGIPGIPVMLSIDGVDVALLAVHPAAPRSSITAARRDQSFAAITTFAEDHDGLVIVVGDLNATPWSYAFRLLKEQTGLWDSQQGFGIQSTWPSYPGSYFNWALRIPIDHCLHSPEIYTIDRRVGRARRSNHNPILVWLGIPSGTDVEPKR